ncbi:coenzyme F420-reducing hydrogenase beta subunit [Ruminiclostridium sufflavum DSM 19573]|uniref:Coenzyme F420-reducing hydrogenase beta subunit n=1 Tax=Ruminiclostridium sufflavum DSM 19573 TaxID=1121337 RepID=A0A318Y7R7_9FIRM|nr:Coenzyme F420 hydrogenase/dehydrogenase, beta subunit C-terminal domain [Ruminiclostridium sufflavum]PYG88204.1 coenzyme F420-reducing hydrogenase beta subunit [Ruminiclostridium sufflavum DSM 19573]
MIKITEKYNCTGCHACANVCPKECINMESDSEGFLYPGVDLKSCIACGLCEKVCPVSNKKDIDNEPQAFACYSKNEQVRLESSSGGIFTLIAEQIINEGGVVFGVILDKDMTAVHSYAESMEQLKAFRGSKYVQSKIGEAYKIAGNFLKKNRKVLFSGTPCQIAGLKAYLQQEYDNLFCIDIICHGVPSPRAWGKYVSYQESHMGSKVQGANFRHKDKGWNRFSMELEFNNGTRYIQTLDKDLYMQAFLKDACLRPSCHKCSFKTLHRQSDITLADFWGIQKIAPHMDDDKGTSLVFANSGKGKLMLDRLQNLIVSERVDIDKAVCYNPAAFRSAGENPKRGAFFEDIGKLPFDKLAYKYCSESIVITAKRKMTEAAAKVLKKTGLLHAAKKVLK